MVRGSAEFCVLNPEVGFNLLEGAQKRDNRDIAFRNLGFTGYTFIFCERRRGGRQERRSEEGVRWKGAPAVPYDSFFYPLDSVRQWNLLYGKQGFLQYQCVIPETNVEAVEELLDRIARSGMGSFLGVLKQFGSAPPAGMLSFPRPGLTVALDFAMRGERTLRLMQSLDEVVQQSGGALYPAKDARMSPALFDTSFPRWRGFVPYIDPKMSSSFWRRVTRAQ